MTSGTKWKGKDGYYYYTGVSGIKNLLLENWKEKGLKPYSQTNNKDFYKLLIDKYGNVLNKERVKQIRKDNLNFFYTLQSLGIKGIITMDIDAWSNAGGHTTLWNGSEFLDDTNYLNDERNYVFVRELCFWELK